MAQAPRGFLWQMSSSMPWSLPLVSLCAPPQWKTLTHQLPPVAQQDSSCPHQGKFHNRHPLFVGTAFPPLSYLREWFREQKQGNRGTMGLMEEHSHILSFFFSEDSENPLNCTNLSEISRFDLFISRYMFGIFDH